MGDPHVCFQAPGVWSLCGVPGGQSRSCFFLFTSSKGSHGVYSPITCIRMLARFLPLSVYSVRLQAWGCMTSYYLYKKHLFFVLNTTVHLKCCLITMESQGGRLFCSQLCWKIRKCSYSALKYDILTNGH